MILNIVKPDDVCKRKDISLEINGMSANWQEFGTIEDDIPEYQTEEEFYNGWEYCCQPEKFVPKPFDDLLCLIYKITPSEYEELCNKLKEVLQFDGCAWCQ